MAMAMEHKGNDGELITCGGSWQGVHALSFAYCDKTSSSMKWCMATTVQLCIVIHMAAQTFFSYKTACFATKVIEYSGIQNE